MISMSRLVEMHVREFASRQKHQDEINAEECARNADCAKRAKAARDAWRQTAIINAGPMCLLDAVGQAEESWVEMFERAPRCDLPQPKETDPGLSYGYNPARAGA